MFASDIRYNYFLRLYCVTSFLRIIMYLICLTRFLNNLLFCVLSRAICLIKIIFRDRQTMYLFCIDVKAIKFWLRRLVDPVIILSLSRRNFSNIIINHIRIRMMNCFIRCFLFTILCITIDYHGLMRCIRRLRTTTMIRIYNTLRYSLQRIRQLNKIRRLFWCLRHLRNLFFIDRIRVRYLRAIRFTLFRIVINLRRHHGRGRWDRFRIIN